MLFYNNKFLVMTDCPLCDLQFIEGYQHTEFLIVICSHCYKALKRYQMHRSFTRFSLFQSQLSVSSNKANKILQNFIRQTGKDIRVLLKNGVIEQCFKPSNDGIQKTERFSLTTEDTDTIPEGMNPIKTTASRIILERCQAKVVIIATKIEPACQKILKTKETLKESAASLKNRYQELKAEYRNIRAELPPLGGLAREAKNKLGSLLKLF